MDDKLLAPVSRAVPMRSFATAMGALALVAGCGAGAESEPVERTSSAIACAGRDGDGNCILWLPFNPDGARSCGATPSNPQLSQGEFAVYSQPNYSGLCSIFPANVRLDLVYLGWYAPNPPTPNKGPYYIRSVKTGPSTAVTLWAAENYSGSSTQLLDYWSYSDLTNVIAPQSLQSGVAPAPELPTGAVWFNPNQSLTNGEVILSTDPYFSGYNAVFLRDTYEADLSQVGWATAWYPSYVRSVSAGPNAHFTAYPCTFFNCAYSFTLGPNTYNNDTTFYEMQALTVWNEQHGVYLGQDWGLFEEWDRNYWKGTCIGYYGLSGLSVDTGTRVGHSVLCRTNGGIGATTYGGVYAATLAIPGDNRRSTRIVNGSTEWDLNHWKEECGFGEYVSGVSENPADCTFHAIRCAKDNGTVDTECHVQPIGDLGDARTTTDTGDWDQNYFKSECGPHEYMAGVSVDPATSLMHAALCCSRY
jgi:hypothetical protein